MRSPAKRPFILLVEDSEDDAFFFRWTVDKCGLASEVEHVDDGGTAIERLEKGFAGRARLPDFVFLDLKLPTFSGFEVLSWIRQQHPGAALDVAVLSGSEHGMDVARAKALGASAYYVKPLSIEQLRAQFASWREQQEAQCPAVPEVAHACAAHSSA